MKPLTFDEAVRLAEDHGFAFRRAKGSHRIYRNASGARVIIPFHRGNIPIGTERAILRAIGIDPATFR